MLNEINLNALNEFAQVIKEDPTEGIAGFGVVANWKNGVNSKITTLPKTFGKNTTNPKQFSFNVGEPQQILGDDLSPSPQDYILGGMASCMLVTFVALATKQGLKLENVKVIIRGDLDLRGFMELDPDSFVGYGQLDFRFEVTGKGTQEEFIAIAEHVRKVSPGYRTISDKVRVILNNKINE